MERTQSTIHTEFGTFTIYIYKHGGKEHVAFVSGNISNKKDVLLRVHSECLTGEVFHSIMCDCRDQLLHALQAISQTDGLVIYLRQEGRGIGLFNKIRAYELQQQGYDTVEANEKLGFDPDLRNFSIVPEILQDLEVQSVRVITNNPRKKEAIEKHIPVSEILPAGTKPKPENLRYLKTKAEKCGHMIKIADEDLVFMQEAIDQAKKGTKTHPNPRVGCVVTRDSRVLAKGHHEFYGGPHAEVVALEKCKDARGATMYITLEPCCHQGKTPPCVEAILQAGISRIVIGMIDPNPAVRGKGVEQLEEAGVKVTVINDEDITNQLLELNKEFIDQFN